MAEENRIYRQRYRLWFGRGDGDIRHPAKGKVYGLKHATGRHRSDRGDIFVAAFVLFKTRQAGPAASSRVVKRSPFGFGILAFVAGSAFHLVAQLGGNNLWPVASAAIALLLPILVIGVVRSVIKSGAWTDAHTDAMMIGGLLAYCWLGFFLTVRMHGVATVPGQIFPCAVVLALVYGRFVHRVRRIP